MAIVVILTVDNGALDAELVCAGKKGQTFAFRADFRFQK